MDNDKVRNLIRIAFLALGIGMIVYGATHGEAAIVLRKAVKVCLECIGLG
ncbi:MAG: thioredoxin [Mogibacterium sp.]|nr:thioredoxin [Mogibacterium sp.]